MTNGLFADNNKTILGLKLTHLVNGNVFVLNNNKTILGLKLILGM